MKLKCVKNLCVSPFWSSTGFSSCPFYKGSGKIILSLLTTKNWKLPISQKNRCFNKLLKLKSVHVSDRCTKIALVRKTDCFSIGPDLPNSNADAFHKGMGNIIAKSLENDIGLLHIGYLTIAQIPLSSLGQLYLEYLSKDIDTLEILGTSMEDH